MKELMGLLATASIFGLLLSASGLLVMFSSKPSSARLRTIAKATAIAGLVMLAGSLLILAAINSFLSPS